MSVAVSSTEHSTYHPKSNAHAKAAHTAKSTIVDAVRASRAESASNTVLDAAGSRISKGRLAIRVGEGVTRASGIRRVAAPVALRDGGRGPFADLQRAVGAAALTTSVDNLGGGFRRYGQGGGKEHKGESGELHDRR